MKKEVFEYKLTRDKQLIAHAIQYAVATSADMKNEYKDLVGLLTIHADLYTLTVNFRREIDFPTLEKLTKTSMEMCFAELSRIGSLLESPMPDFDRGLEVIRNIDVKAVLQNTEAEFYDFLMDYCKHPYKG